MAASRYLHRSPTSQTLKDLVKPLRWLSSSSSTSTADAAAPSDHNHNQQNHNYLSPNHYINSWNLPKTPKEAEFQLLQLRREYAKKVKEFRKEFIQEMELQRIEKQIKDEKKKEALRIATEERKAAKAAAKKAKAAERQVAEEEFRRTLLKERTEKLEYWRKREKQVEEKKKEKNELLRRQSSVWVEEGALVPQTLEAIVDKSNNVYL